MTATAEHTQEARAAAPPVSLNPYIGCLGVFLGAATTTLNGKPLSAGLPDLRGALDYSFDDASWIPTVLNMSIMFTGVFAAFLGSAYGVRRVLLVSGAIFTAASIVLPFAPNLSVMLALQAARSLPKKLILLGIAAYALDIVVSSHVAYFIHGWYMDQLSWHWIFWTAGMLMPVTMLCLYVGVPPAGMPEPPNWHGFFYVSGGLILIYAALDQNGVPFLVHNFGTFGAALNYDVFDFGKRRAVVRGRQAQLAQAQENLERLKDAVNVQVEQSLNKVQRTRQMLQVASEVVKLRQEGERLAEAK